MLQIILILLGLATSGSEQSTQSTNIDQTVITQSDIDPGLDTGGETSTPPKR